MKVTIETNQDGTHRIEIWNHDTTKYVGLTNTIAVQVDENGYVNTHELKQGFTDELMKLIALLQ